MAQIRDIPGNPGRVVTLVGRMISTMYSAKTAETILSGSTKQPLVCHQTRGVQIFHRKGYGDAVFCHISLDTCFNFLRLRTTAGEMQPHSRLSSLVSTFCGWINCYFLFI